MFFTLNNVNWFFNILIAKSHIGYPLNGILLLIQRLLQFHVEDFSKTSIEGVWSNKMQDIWKERLGMKSKNNNLHKYNQSIFTHNTT